MAIPVYEVPVAYHENVARVLEVILGVAKDFRADPEFTGSVTDDPIMLGVGRFTDCGVVIKFMMKTRPEQMFPVRRQMLRPIQTLQRLGATLDHLVRQYCPDKACKLNMTVQASCVDTLQESTALT